MSAATSISNFSWLEIISRIPPTSIPRIHAPRSARSALADDLSRSAPDGHRVDGRQLDFVPRFVLQ